MELLISTIILTHLARILVFQMGSWQEHRVIVSLCIIKISQIDKVNDYIDMTKLLT